MFALCGAKTETLTVVHEFTFLTGTSKVSEIFTQYYYVNSLLRPNFSELLDLQNYIYHLHLYRLSYFDRLLL